MIGTSWFDQLVQARHDRNKKTFIEVRCTGLESCCLKGCNEKDP